MASLLPSVDSTDPPMTYQINGPSLSTSPLFRDSLHLGRGDVKIVAEGHKAIGMRMLNAKAYQAAINNFEIARKYNPQDDDLYYLLGSSYTGLGLSAQAADNYRRCKTGPYASVAIRGLQREVKRLGIKTLDKLEVPAESDIGLPNQPTINNSLK